MLWPHAYRNRVDPREFWLSVMHFTLGSGDWCPSRPVANPPDICATSSADLTDESRLKIGEPQIIRPLIDHGWRQRDVMAAPIVAAEHDQPARAGGSHL